MSMTLPRFATVEMCPKCGSPTSEMASAVYHAEVQLEGAERTPCSRLFMTVDLDELGEEFDLEAFLENHLCRTCRRCGFEWVERALDAPEVAEETV